MEAGYEMQGGMELAHVFIIDQFCIEVVEL
jgi:hypothetical protein